MSLRSNHSDDFGPETDGTEYLEWLVSLPRPEAAKPDIACDLSGPAEGLGGAAGVAMMQEGALPW